jgi:uncharacterized membrane protein AbrB (regulator of aidB expression)
LRSSAAGSWVSGFAASGWRRRSCSAARWSPPSSICTFLGDRFQNFDWRTAPALLPAAVGSFAVGITAAGLFAALAAAVSGVGLGEALVAFAPGGLEAMMVLALILGFDPLYVGTHHLVRMVALGVGVPLLVTWLDRGRAAKAG